MTWTYSGDPSSDEKDAVRFLIGDTDSDDELIQDEEINYLLDEEGAVKLAAARAAETIAAKFARKADRTIGDYSEKFSQKADNYFSLAKELEQQYDDDVSEKAMPYAGGISKTDKESRENNTDRVKPAFSKGMMDNDTEGLINNG